MDKLTLALNVDLASLQGTTGGTQAPDGGALRGRCSCDLHRHCLSDLDRRHAQ
jgi:hypothetical protein